MQKNEELEKWESMGFLIDPVEGIPETWKLPETEETEKTELTNEAERNTTTKYDFSRDLRIILGSTLFYLLLKRVFNLIAAIIGTH